MHHLTKNTKLILLVAVLFVGGVSFAHASGVISASVQQMLWWIVNNLFGWMLGIAGLVLNFAINDFIIGFGDKFLGSGVGVVVDKLWENVRDIFNLTFIFGLVYIGFKIILDSDDSRTRQWLIHLILAALLVNFSLYITKFIVDISNITATQIIINGFETTPNKTADISGYFMDMLGIKSVMTSADGGLAEEFTKGENSAWGYIFGTAILFIISTYVFAVGGIMLIIRYVSLILYMVLSPLMFIGWVFPQMDEYTRKYWKGFLGRAFFAPVYIILVYFAALVVDAFYVQANNTSPDFKLLFVGKGADIMGGGANSTFATTLPPFILACMFLVGAVVVGNKLSADGAGTAINFGRNMTQKFRRSVTGASRAVGQAAWAQTGGRTLRYASDTTGKGLEKRLNRLQTSDGRFGSVARWAGADRVVRGTANKLQNAKYGMNTTRDQDAKLEGDINERYQKSNNLKDQETILSDVNTSAEDVTKAFQDLAKHLKDFTTNDLKTLGLDKLKEERIALNLNDKQIEALEKDGAYSASELQQIKDARKKASVNVATGNLTTLTSSQAIQNALDEQNNIRANFLRNKSISDIGKLDNGVFTAPEMIQHLEPSAIAEKMKNGGLSNKEIEDIKDNIEKHLKDLAQNNAQQYTSEAKRWDNTIKNNTVLYRLNVDPNVLNQNPTPTPKIWTPGQP